MLEVLDGFIRMSFLSRHHTQIVPCFRVVRAQLQCLPEIAAGFLKIIFAKT